MSSIEWGLLQVPCAVNSAQDIVATVSVEDSFVAYSSVYTVYDL